MNDKRRSVSILFAPEPKDSLNHCPAEDGSGVGTAHADDHCSRGSSRGPSNPQLEESYGRWPVREATPYDGHHPLGRSPKSISREGLIAADQLEQAFQSGDASLAYESGLRLTEAYRALWFEAANLRFRLNFGSPLCEHCEGLKAGAGVVATCFQVRQCNFDNIKEGQVTPRQQRVLDRLLDSKKS